MVYCTKCTSLLFVQSLLRNVISYTYDLKVATNWVVAFVSVHLAARSTFKRSRLRLNTHHMPPPLVTHLVVQVTR